MQGTLIKKLFEEKNLIELHCPDFVPLDQEFKVYEGNIFYKNQGKISKFKVLMEIPSDFPKNPPKFRALQDSNWKSFHPISSELEQNFFSSKSFVHACDYILYFKGEFLNFLLSDNGNHQKKQKKAKEKEISDLTQIIRLAKHNSKGKWINKEILISKSHWNLDRINNALNILENEGLARKIISRSTGTRWYFPGI